MGRLTGIGLVMKNCFDDGFRKGIYLGYESLELSFFNDYKWFILCLFWLNFHKKLIFSRQAADIWS